VCLDWRSREGNGFGRRPLSRVWPGGGANRDGGLEPIGGNSMSKPFVMVIDDDDDLRFVVRMSLDLDGCEVEDFADGRKALARALERLPDVIVCDIMMPEFDGFHVLEALRKHEKTADVPLVFLTAKGSDGEIWDGWRAGADYYLTKPFDPEELVRFVKHLKKETDVPYPEEKSLSENLS